LCRRSAAGNCTPRCIPKPIPIRWTG
jgi:hypothetical protein